MWSKLCTWSCNVPVMLLSPMKDTLYYFTLHLFDETSLASVGKFTAVISKYLNPNLVVLDLFWLSRSNTQLAFQILSLPTDLNLQCLTMSENKWKTACAVTGGSIHYHITTWGNTYTYGEHGSLLLRQGKRRI